MCFIITLLGYICLFYILFRLCSVLYSIFYPYFIGRPIDLKKAAGGKWAVITGATDGIGKGYAFELARKGFSIVLISRSEIKLHHVKEQLIQEANTHDVQVITIVFDFVCQSTEEYERIILSQLRNLDVGILVNNVGISFDYPELLHLRSYDLKKIADVAVVNMLPATILSAAVLPQMLKRNSGIIVNISSGAAHRVFKYWNVYAATKAYISWLTKIMQREYADTNIIIQLVCPMIVETNMSKDFLDSRPAFFNVETVENYVQSAVRSIGLASETAGCVMHQLQEVLPKIMPDMLIQMADKQIEKYIKEVAMLYQSKKST